MIKNVDKTVEQARRSVTDNGTQQPIQFFLLSSLNVFPYLGVLPKSTNPSHIRKNFELDRFQLSNGDMKELNSLSKNLHYCWDPTVIKWKSYAVHRSKA